MDYPEGTRDHFDGQNSWREQIVAAVLRAYAIVGLPVWIWATWLICREGAYGVATALSVAYLALAAVALTPRLSYRFRAGALLWYFYFTGVLGLVAVGPHASGAIVLFAFIVVAAMLHGLRAALLAIAAVTATFISIGALHVANWLDPVPTQPPDSPAAWITAMCLVLLLGTSVAASLTYLVGRFEESLSHSRTLIRHLRKRGEERDRAEASLRESEEQLRHSQRMEAMGKLAGGVAHDFNNLLTVIRGYGQEVLVHESEDPPDYEEAGRAICDAAEKGATLTRQLLNFSRRRVTRASPLDLNEIVHGTKRMLRPLIGENIELTMILGEEVPYILAEAGQLEQVLVNLVVNARDAVGDQGKISISTEAIEANQLRCAPGSEPSGARIRVADNGCGFSAELQAQIFEPFFTTKEAGEGTGLGLATVYGIVQRNQGEIHVESTPGVGTVFEIDLPGVAVPAEFEIAEESAASTAPRGGTILLAEDDEAVRELTGGMLTDAGYDVLAAEDGEAALALAAAHTGTIELLLTDVVMPRMGGHELARQIRERRPDIEVVFMSGFPELKGDRFSDLERFKDARLLGKPFTRSELLAAVCGPTPSAV